MTAGPATVKAHTIHLDKRTTRKPAQTNPGHAGRRTAHPPFRPVGRDHTPRQPLIATTADLHRTTAHPPHHH